MGDSGLRKYRTTAAVAPGNHLTDAKLSVDELVGFLRGVANNMERRRDEAPSLTLHIETEPDDG